MEGDMDPDDDVIPATTEELMLDELRDMRQDLQLLGQLEEIENYTSSMAEAVKDIQGGLYAINTNIYAIRLQIAFISFVIFVAAIVWLIPAVKSWLGF
jgi:hypothetical protein